MFVDHIKIYAKAGDGGNGSCSFRREKFVPKGGPDGGDGGRGGSIILVADPHIDNLTPFFYESILKAKNGANGMGKQKYGRSAEDRIVKVPIGTMIYRLPEGVSPFAPKKKAWELAQEAEQAAELARTGALEIDLANEPLDEDDADDVDENDTDASFEEEAADAHDENAGAAESPLSSKSPSPLHPAPANEPSRVGTGAADQYTSRHALSELDLIADLDHEGARLVLCHGGKGGRGNLHYKSSRNRTPRQWEPGHPGDEGYFLLELRKIADAGLVGYPNAGKSTLLGKISSAHPKVAPYPFTTLHPIIGMVDFPSAGPGSFAGFQRAAVADIPGLIEGAHRNVGLGHEFLRHIVRCRVLIFVIDMAGSDERNPVDDLGQLRKELGLYDPTLPDRPWFIVANKMDDPRSDENLRHFRHSFPKREIIPLSAELGEGIGELKAALGRYLAENPAPQRVEAVADEENTLGNHINVTTESRVTDGME